MLHMGGPRVHTSVVDGGGGGGGADALCHTHWLHKLLSQCARPDIDVGVEGSVQ